MTETLRMPFFVLALVLLAFAVSFEIGLALAWPALVPPPGGGLSDISPGFGVPYLAAIDLILVYATLAIALALLWPALAGRVQAAIGILLALIGGLAVLALILAAFAALMLMLTLLLAVPFGTLAYFAAFADFPTGKAAAALALIMAFKLGFAICLILAHQRFLKMKTLMLVIASSLALTWLTAVLHALVPGFLASIADALAALITSVLALVWIVALFIGTLPGLIRAIRSLLTARPVS
ncbi:hypothetical protein [Rhodovulum sp. MB263]|uniref:hypothetical protein n=1 Tax=Rhodovulum sp. (strain MB263) TaxID=308754 RepID=UPI0009B7CFC7|nr:hypothetical protein [Rhodovulum sp. MB263]ARC90654.1 hypothetical protein B5V46_18370 [Rhodovulum sp. MB263]